MPQTHMLSINRRIKASRSEQELTSPWPKRNTWKHIQMCFLHVIFRLTQKWLNLSTLQLHFCLLWQTDSSSVGSYWMNLLQGDWVTSHHVIYIQPHYPTFKTLRPVLSSSPKSVWVNDTKEEERHKLIHEDDNVTTHISPDVEFIFMLPGQVRSKY